MAKYSHKMMGKEVGAANVYAKPHTMSGKATSGDIPKKPYVNEKSAKDADINDPVPTGVAYGLGRQVKTTGIKMRGTGAATKGVMSRGPMA
jgi:hypothetical protein